MPTLKIHHDAWVLVADGTKALFLHNAGDEEILNLRRREVRAQDNPATRDQGSDASGRASSLGTQSGSLGGTDFHRLEEDRFAAAVTEEINRGAQAGAFREIVIVAPAKCLAEIRRDLSVEAAKRVSAEIAKDYTHHPIPEIETLLAAHEVG